MRIQAHGVGFAYPGSPRTQVEALALDLPAGSFTGVAGPNGTGKSTLLKLLAGLLVPQSGEILLDGRPLVSYSRRAVAARVAWVGQASTLPFPVTVDDLVLSGRFPHAGLFTPLARADRNAAREAMEALGIAALGPRRVQTLSGGERQLAVLARALATGAPVLLLDEPVAHLDPRHHAEMARALMNIHRQGRTVVLSSHDYNFLRHFCADLLLLKEGRVLLHAPAAEVPLARWETLFGVPFVEAPLPSGEGTLIAPRVDAPVLRVRQEREDGTNLVRR